MPEKINLGLIGVGHMGLYHVNVSAGLTNEYDVVGICDADENRCNDIAKRYSFPVYKDRGKLMDDSDAVVIAVPTKFHYEVALDALNRGCHVLVEKPLTETVEQAKELVELAQKKGLILQVGHVERFNGAVLELGKIVDKPYLIESRRLAPFNPRINDVGVVLDLMIHDLDIILNLVKSPVKSIYARGTKAYSDYEDVASALIHFESGTVATLVASRATQGKIRTLTISQEKAYVVLDFSTQDIDIHRQASSAYLMNPEELKYRQESFVEKIAVHKDNPLRQEHLHFIGCILGGETPFIEGQSNINTLEVAHRILDQVKSGM